MPRDLLEYMKSLPQYSDFDKQTAMNATFPDVKTAWNEAAWNDKMLFWTKVLKEATSNGWIGDSKLAINLHNLHDHFNHNGTYPLCLDSVVRNLISQGTLFSMQDSIIQRTWNYLFSSLEQEYAFEPLCAEQSRLIEQMVSKNALFETDYILEKHQILEMANMSEKDFNILLKYQEKRGIVKTREIMGKTLVLYITPKTKNIDLSQQHAGLIKLKNIIKDLTLQIADLECKIKERTNAAKDALRIGLKPKAVHCLRQKKMMMSLYEKRLESQNTLQNIVEKIHSSQSDIDIIQAISAGTESLKVFLGAKELDINHIEDVMDSLEQALGDQKEIEDCMAQLPTQEFVDEEQLELELENLIGKSEERDESTVIQELEALKVSKKEPKLKEKKKESIALPN